MFHSLLKRWIKIGSEMCRVERKVSRSGKLAFS